jgi:hypothetical protein
MAWAMNDETVSGRTGFLLLPPSRVPGYRGVDRCPFEPLIRMQDIDPTISIRHGDDRVWPLYPPGWRRDAYRLYEDNCDMVGDDLCLLQSVEVAYEIEGIIEGHVGFHEVIRCTVWAESSPMIEDDVSFYSAILNGLLVNPDPALVGAFGTQLDAHKLFRSSELALEYVPRFREAAPSEASSCFCIYGLQAEDRA